MDVVGPHPYANYECMTVWVVETSDIFPYEPNYKVVDLCHLWDEAHQVDVLHHL